MKNPWDALRAKLSGKTEAKSRSTPSKSPSKIEEGTPASKVKSSRPDRADATTTRTSSQVRTGSVGPSGVDRNDGQARLDITIGLDFGTRFTKVGYRIVGIDRSRIVIPDPSKPDSALFRSRAFVGTKTKQVHRRRPKETFGIEELPYLKLLLKNLDQPTVLVPLMLQKIIDVNSIKVISAFYLSGILRHALVVIAQQEASRLRDRRVSYALNVSLPADYCDDAATETFREVGLVALQWALGPIGALEQASLSELFSSYQSDCSRPANFEVAVFPEIIAALYDFITRRDTASGIYGFLDIGGGTIDGCIFRVLRERNRPQQVDVLAAKVAALGTIVTAKKSLAFLYGDLEKRIESEIVTCNDVHINVPLPLDRVAQELGDFTGKLLVSARDKMPDRTLIHDANAIVDSKSKQRELERNFNIFLTGGGAKSGWYRGVVAAVHEERKLSSHGIMPYRCELLRPPSDFDGSTGIAFERFVIANGLTEDAVNLENLKTKLPSQLKPPMALPARDTNSVNYADSKEVLT